MGALPILQQDSNQPLCLSNDMLPTFYMSDYSVLGLKVASLERAQRVLAEKNIAVIDKSDHLEVSIAGAGQIYAIVNLLNQSGLDCQVADIADQIYQG